MRPQDRPIFLGAASLVDAWILVRRTNEASLKYICRAGYTPKPIHCKAKTADLNGSSGQELAGLVVVPTIHPHAFRGEKAREARKEWKKMYRNTNDLSFETLPVGYSVDTRPESRHYGCLKLHNKYLHGDYDLYDIILTSHPRGNLALVTQIGDTPHRRGPRFYQVQEYVNSRIGSPMLQHSGQLQFADHLDETIDAFGPNGEDLIIGPGKIRQWYSENFRGRQPIPV
jgi:hypothetical protein